MRSHALAFTLLLDSSSPLWADDGTSGFVNGALVFGQSKTIVMQKETLTVSLARITADFIFINKGDKPETLTVAFPLPDVREAETDEFYIPVDDDNFVGFVTKIDGKAIRQNVEQRAFLDNGREVTADLKKLGIPLVRSYYTLTDLFSAMPKAKQASLMAAGLVDGDIGNLSPVWTTKTKFYFQQSFEPGKAVHIVHTYQPSYDTSNMTYYSEGGHPDDDQIRMFCLTAKTKAAVAALEKTKTDNFHHALQYFLNYVLSTARTWAGPIGEFHLIIEKRNPTDVASFCVDAKPVSPTRFEFDATNYVPDKDLSVIFFQ